MSAVDERSGQRAGVGAEWNGTGQRAGVGECVGEVNGRAWGLGGPSVFTLTCGSLPPLVRTALGCSLVLLILPSSAGRIKAKPLLRSGAG